MDCCLKNWKWPLLFGAAALFSGCATTETPRSEEVVWQALHLIDTAQTVQLARSESDCFWEDAPGTEQIIGKHPSTNGVLMWGVGAAAAHFGISKWLKNNTPPWVYATWQSITIVRSSYYVQDNYKKGIGLTGSHC